MVTVRRLLWLDRWWLLPGVNPKGGGYRMWQKAYWRTFDTSKATPLDRWKSNLVWFVLGLLLSPLVQALWRAVLRWLS